MSSSRRSTQWTVVCLIAVTTMLAMPAQAAAESGAPTCRIPQELAWTPPGPDFSPTSVRVGLFILDFAKIDELTESFTTDLLLVARWHDPRLAEASLGTSVAGCLFRLADVWSPRVAIVNQRIVSSRGDEVLRIDPAGNIDFRVGYYGDFASPLDLRRFPFDSQSLRISISTDYGPETVVLAGDAATTGLLPGAAIAGWRILGVDEAPVARTIKAAGATYGITEFSVSIQREQGYYLWKVFLPLSFIVAMASVVFWLDPKQFGSQIGVSTASAFTLVAFLLSLNRFLPRVSYLTLADHLVLGAMALVFGALGQCVATSRLAQTGRDEAAYRIDEWARWVYPLAFVGIIVGVLVGV